MENRTNLTKELVGRITGMNVVTAVTHLKSDGAIKDNITVLNYKEYSPLVSEQVYKEKVKEDPKFESLGLESGTETCQKRVTGLLRYLAARERI